MEDLYDPEEKILCPYNNAHHIRRCKMSFHLVKCRQSVGEQVMIQCDFNATHVIPEAELQYHHQICPDRKKVEARIIESRSKADEKFPVYKVEVASEENWDDNNYPTYDPTVYATNNDVLRHLDVASGAKRRQFRMEERRRLSELSSQNKALQPPAENVRPRINLPERRQVTVIKEKKDTKSLLQEKLKIGADKVYLKVQSGPSGSNNN